MTTIHINPDGTWGDDFVEIDTTEWHPSDFDLLDFCRESDRFDLAHAITAWNAAGRPRLDWEPTDMLNDRAARVIQWWFNAGVPE